MEAETDLEIKLQCNSVSSTGHLRLIKAGEPAIVDYLLNFIPFYSGKSREKLIDYHAERREDGQEWINWRGRLQEDITGVKGMLYVALPLSVAVYGGQVYDFLSGLF